MSIKWRLQELAKIEGTQLAGEEFLRAIGRDALAEIERFEVNAANYDIPRKTENVVRIAAALIIAGHDRDLAMRRALESYEVLVCAVKDASNR